jgi:DNA modification methylase
MSIDSHLFGKDLFGDAVKPQSASEAVLAQRFGAAPFTVFNAREGWWQERKQAWIDLGIESEVGRGENLLNLSEAAKLQKRKPLTYGASQNDPVSKEIEDRGGGTSIFDPVLCELAYRWFSPRGGIVLDPFAGGSVRGIVAAMMDRFYVGVELREEQVEANNAQSGIAPSRFMPQWIQGDSLEITKKFYRDYDFILSCPPYGDLEVYSDDPADLSNMSWDEFLAAYKQIISQSCAVLKPDRFACFVVGDFRDKKGLYKLFPWHTIQAFEDAGLKLYNEAILITAIGTLGMRTSAFFDKSRKLGKTHQNILIFVKGDPKRATEAVLNGEITEG